MLKFINNMVLIVVIIGIYNFGTLKEVVTDYDRTPKRTTIESTK